MVSLNLPNYMYLSAVLCVQANDEFRSRCESQVSAAKASQTDVEERLTALQQEHEKLITENTDVEKQFEQEVCCY